MLRYLSDKDFNDRKWLDAGKNVDDPLAQIRRIPVIQNICTFLGLDLVEAHLKRQLHVYSDTELSRHSEMGSKLTLIFKGKKILKFCNIFYYSARFWKSRGQLVDVTTTYDLLTYAPSAAWYFGRFKLRGLLLP